MADGDEGRECKSEIPEVILGSMLLSGGKVSNSRFGLHNAWYKSRRVNNPRQQ